MKTFILSSSRAGLGSVLATNPGLLKTQVISNVGAVVSPANPALAAPFIIHSFP
jgi:hypothetical protein